MTTDIFVPNASVQPKVRTGVVGAWLLLAVAFWQMAKPSVFPNPLEILQAVPGLVAEGMIPELVSSFMTNMEALCLSVALGLPLSYLSRVPAVSPLAQFVGKLRFVSSAVFFLPLLFLLSGGHWVKVWLLVLGQLFYLVTTMVGVVQSIPEFRFDDARTLRMSEWRSVWYVVVRSTVPDVLTAIRDNAAMGWAMLMFVEGVIRSEGGIGVMMLNMEKHVNFAEVYALALVILLVGIGQDWVLGQVKKAMCPYV